MAVTDPIADMLTRMRNAITRAKPTVDIPSSKIKVGLARTLKEEGYILDYRVIEDNKQGTIRLYLKYGPDGQRVITVLNRVSRPGRRVYARADEISPVRSGLGIAIVSTSKGVLSDRRCRQMRLGGELLCIVW